MVNRHAMRVAVMLSACDEVTPDYAATIAATKVDPTARWQNKIPATAKRDRQRANKLTGQVWAALSGTEPTVINGVTVYPIGYGEETQ